MATVKLPKPTELSELGDLPAYSIHEGNSDERIREMGLLLSATHRKVAPLRDPSLILHSHMPHILGSAFYLGASKTQLQETWQKIIDTLKPRDADVFVKNGSIPKDRYREYMEKKEYSVAWMDYFDQAIEDADGAFQPVVESYLFGENGHLMNGLMGGLGHPLIDLHYAYEFCSGQVASEGMSLLCTDYYPGHGILDHPPYDNSTYKTRSLADIVGRIFNDHRLVNIPEQIGIASLEQLMQTAPSIVLEHWNAWEIDSPLQALENACDTAVLVAISSGSKARSFDFHLIHLLTTAHAMRYIWNRIPAQHQISMLRQYALVLIQIYILQHRPAVSLDAITSVSTQGRDWKWVMQTGLNHPAKFDVHFFKVVRAPHVLAQTYGEKNGFYLKSAIKFLDEYSGFEGFPPMAEDGASFLPGGGDFDPWHEQWQAPGKLRPKMSS